MWRKQKENRKQENSDTNLMVKGKQISEHTEAGTSQASAAPRCEDLPTLL